MTYTSVRNFDGSHRVYDYGTGFKTSHITSGISGERRKVFTDEQQLVMKQLAGEWLQCYGFKI